MKKRDNFIGSFSKSHHYTYYSEEEFKDFWNEEDERMYQKAGRDIRRILGKKEKYTGREAAYFFQKKYRCFQIPYAYEWTYRTSPHPTFARFEPFGYPEYEPDDDPFHYFEGPRPKEEEKIIALLFDYFNNERFYKRYESIKKEREDYYSYFSSPFEVWGEFNEILVIGSYDEISINSMTLDGANLYVDEVQYEMWYFYHHS